MATEPDIRGALVLFVEDHHATREALTRLLLSEGFRVDPAADGVTGMVLARRRAHDVMLLDLCLPDTPGLALLGQLRQEGVFLPCVILTGFPGCQSGFEAGRLGAVAYLEKPAVAAELVSALRRALCSSADGVTPAFAQPPVCCSPLLVMLTTAIEHLPATDILPDPGAEDVLRRRVGRVMAQAADSPLATICLFVAIASGIRVLLDPQARQPLGSQLASIRLSFSRTVERDALPLQPDAHGIMATLLTSGAALRNLRQDEVASMLHLSVTRVCKLLDEQYGLSFSDCRLAVIMRKVVCELSRGSEHVRQIAYHAGYEDHGNFDRAFRGFFGVTPTQFRRLRARAAGPS